MVYNTPRHAPQQPGRDSVMISPRIAPRYVAALAAAALTVIACNRQVNVASTAPSGLTGQPAAGSTRTAIHFRVQGSVINARVRYSTPADGLAQTITSVPFDTGFTTSADSVFLSLDATPILFDGSVTFPFFLIQILVDDQVFREAAASNGLIQTLSVSGTWRR